MIFFHRIFRAAIYAKRTNNNFKVLAFSLSHVTAAMEVPFSVGVQVLNYTQLVEDCIRSKSLIEGKKIHQLIIENNTHFTDSTVLGKLARLYMECNEVELARNVFDKIPDPNVILWNLMIRAYAWNGPFEKSIDLFHHMLESGIQPSKFTYTFVLKACSRLQAVEVGKEVHDHAKRFGLHLDVFICTALVDLYAKCGDLIEARRVFDSMRCRDVVAWNSMIAGFCLHGQYEETMGLLVQMQETGISPNSSTIVSILPAVAEANAAGHGKAMHAYSLRKNFNYNVMIGTGLLDMYAKCGCLLYAQRIFHKMGVKNEVTWSAMIGGYVFCDSTKEALNLYDEMVAKEGMSPTPITLGIVLRGCAKITDLERGKRLHCYASKSGLLRDITVGNTLLSVYAKCGHIDDAMLLFDEMTLKDKVSYSAIISGCVQNGNAEEALQIFHDMQLAAIDPDTATMLGILPACSHLAALQHGACGHGYSMVHGFTTDTAVCNAIIDMYSKCGKIDTARKVFDRMHKRDIVSWNVMIVGYGIHGLGVEALSLFQNLEDEGLEPDDVTFISLLSACSHSGLVTEGKYWYNSMRQYFNINPRMEHYACMVDLLARAGLLDEAHNFIQKMPIEPDGRIWGALLAACRVHNNVELGEAVAEKIHILGYEGTGDFVLLGNMYGAVGRWDDAADVRIMQRNLGFKKSPGCSWVEINGVIHAFVGGDRSHPQWEQINKKLDGLMVEMKRLGYHAESSFVLQDVEEEEKERILLYHSEKLAIAFAILNLNPSKPILITKNLRVCGDCHAAIKFISLVSKREIIVRDAIRFHHFKDGICNCGDFW